MAHPTVLALSEAVARGQRECRGPSRIARCGDAQDRCSVMRYRVDFEDMKLTPEKFGDVNFVDVKLVPEPLGDVKVTRLNVGPAEPIGAKLTPADLADVKPTAV